MCVIVCLSVSVPDYQYVCTSIRAVGMAISLTSGNRQRRINMKKQSVLQGWGYLPHFDPLSACLHVCLSGWLLTCLSGWLLTCLSVWLLTCLSGWLLTCLSVLLLTCLSVLLLTCLSVWLYVCFCRLFVCLSVWFHLYLSGWIGGWSSSYVCI